MLYQYMKNNDISLLNYNFNYFFQHCIQKNQIQVISHHFSNHKIEGLTVVDKLGTSFSYEIDNPKVKRNFTLCREYLFCCGLDTRYCPFIKNLL